MFAWMRGLFVFENHDKRNVEVIKCLYLHDPLFALAVVYLDFIVSCNTFKLLRSKKLISPVI